MSSSDHGIGCGTILGICAWAGVGISFLGISDLSSAHSKTMRLEQMQKINTVCCLNMTGQPTQSCQALLPDSITLHESFMHFFCQYKQESIEDLPLAIESSTIRGGIIGGIAALSLVALGCYGAYALYSHCKRRNYTAIGE